VTRRDHEDRVDVQQQGDSGQQGQVQGRPHQGGGQRGGPAGGGALARRGPRQGIGAVSMAPLAADLLAPFPSFGRITDVFRELEEDLNSMIAPVVNNPAVSSIMNVNVDIRETGEAYEIHADVPGLDKKHVQIRVSPDHVLTISAERKYKHKEGDKGDFRRVERAYGTFVRRFALPDDAVTEGIEANIKNGELVIHIPKKIPEEGPAHRDIEIKDHESAGSGGGDRGSSTLDVGAAASAATGAATGADKP